MRNRILLALASTAILSTLAGSAHAQIVRYSNLISPSTSGSAMSSTDLNATWGDRLALTSGGLLQGFQCTVFNSATSNTLPITTATLNIAFYDATTFNTTNLAANTPIGAFFSNLNFGTGLNAGFFTTISFSSLTNLNINLPTNIMVTQRLSNVVGGSTRAGVVTYSQDVVGSQYLSNDNHFRSNTVDGTGLFTIGTNANRIGYSVTMATPEPGSIALVALGGIGALGILRRRKSA